LIARTRPVGDAERAPYPPSTPSTRSPEDHAAPFWYTLLPVPVGENVDAQPSAANVEVRSPPLIRYVAVKTGPAGIVLRKSGWSCFELVAFHHRGRSEKV
jgi:hypothetical protein